MSGQSATTEDLIAPLGGDGAESTRPETAGVGRPRLTVREMQIALEAARTFATGVANADPHGRSSTRTTDRVDADTTTASEFPRSEPWLPEHDGPVSLAGATTPRTRTPRRTTATPQKAVSRAGPARRTVTCVPSSTTAIEPALARVAIAAPPRVVLVPSCGGAGASTATVLLAAALAPVTGAVLLASGPDRGSLSVRADAHGGDTDALAAWTARHPDQRLRCAVPGVATGDAGTGPLILAAAGRDDAGTPLDPDRAAALFTAGTSTRTALLLDWSCPTPLPERVLAAATHVLIVAPGTSPGLLDAEYLAQGVAATAPDSASLSVLTVDVRGRSPRRAGRAALARLKALDLPVAALPYDPALADDPRVRWPMLRRRTRSAVAATMTHVLHERWHVDETPSVQAHR